MLAQLGDVHFAYPGTEIFSGLTLQINDGDRIGLVGPNGCGKSTLLRLLEAQIQPDRGSVARARGSSIGYLKQSQEFDGGSGRTIWQALLRPFARPLEVRAAIADHERRLETSSDPALLAAYGDLVDEYTRLDGYSLESRVRALAHDLGFGNIDLDRSVDTLSGGERGRLELAKTLLEAPDLLLLDEPTNHLDVEATEHLEERLAEWPRAFVLVSHDRYFLRAVCRDIVELENGKAIVFGGGYDRYVVERAERHERLTTQFERQREHIEKTEDFIRRNIAGQKTKQAQSRRKQLEKLEKLERVRDDFKEAAEVKLRFSVGDHAGGREALKAAELSIGYGTTPLIDKLDLVVYRGDRIGIVGGNGAGKSTLMKTLLGKLEPLAGRAERGHEIRVGYFDQKLSELDENRSLIDEIRSVRGDFNEDYARSFLGRFRFSGDDPFRIVKGLSGGERNRLSLAKLMLRPRNLLALDEPTNHLDIPMREVLEAALADYDGTLLVISHDRYFLDQVVTKILHIDRGHATLHAGNYSDFRARQREVHKAAAVAAPRVDKPAPPRVQEREKKREVDRGVEKKKRRFADLEAKIAKAETDIAVIDAQLAADHQGEWQRLHTLVAEKTDLAQKLGSWLSEWEKLGSELES